MNESEQRKYLDALKTEVELRAIEFKDKVFDSIFIGGGTPTAVFNGFLSELMNKVYDCFNFSRQTEFTIEVNPSSFNETKLNEFKSIKVNRISMGVQSLDDDLLKFISRKQCRSDVEKAVDILQKSNFDNISADVMLGLPKQTIKSIDETIEFLINNKFKHLSVYTLQIEEKTPLFQKMQSGTLKALDDDIIANMYNHVYKKLKKSGYIRYELSNFALPGYECRHNIKYWDDTQYLGLGLSAHSYIDGVRFWNTSNFSKYIALLNSQKLAIENSEILDMPTKRTEKIMLSLRREDGLNLKNFEKEFNENLLMSHADAIKNLEEMGLIEIKNDYLKIKEDKFELLNSIILELL